MTRWYNCVLVSLCYRSASWQLLDFGLICLIKELICVCLFVLILYVPSSIFKLNRDGSSWTSTKLGEMCLAQGPQRSDAREARTRDPSVSSQALYH